MNYNEFLHTKIEVAPVSGFEVRPEDIHPALKPHQRDKELYAPKQTANHPAIPGHDDLYNVSEMAFHNGEQHMKEKIINLLMEHKTQVKGVCHAHVVEIVKMVEGL